MYLNLVHFYAFLVHFEDAMPLSSKDFPPVQPTSFFRSPSFADLCVVLLSRRSSFASPHFPPPSNLSSLPQVVVVLQYFPCSGCCRGNRSSSQTHQTARRFNVERPKDIKRMHSWIDLTQLPTSVNFCLTSDRCTRVYVKMP